MAIELIIEDGTGKPEANSYVDVDFVTKYLQDRGVTVPEVEKLKSLLIKAVDYMEGFTSLKGTKSSSIQSLLFPRSNVHVGKTILPSDEIPRAVKQAQAQLVMDTVQSGKELYPATRAFALKMRKLGPLTQQWAVSSGTQEPQIPHKRFFVLMADLMVGSRSGGVYK